MAEDVAALALVDRLAVDDGAAAHRTEIEVWADAGIEGAIHRVEVEADDIRLELTSRNRPSETNPRTSRAVAPSVLAALRALVAPVQVGS